MSKRKVTDLIADRLVEHGITDVFMITGGGAMHLNDSLGTHPRLRYYCNHHEQASAIAAEGYARASGRMAVVNVTSGPGGTNTLTGVIGQWLDSIPCVYLSGQVKQMTTIAACPELKLRQLGDQEINIIDIVRPVTKYAHMVRDPNEALYHLDRAIYLAKSGRPGPCWLDWPLDVQGAMVEPSAQRKYSPSEDQMVFDMAAVRRSAKLLYRQLQQSQRPVLMAGHGIRLAGAADAFLELVDLLGIPVVTAICGHDLIPSDHPLFFGRPGIVGDRRGNMVVQNSDCFVAIGARLGVRQIGYSYEAFARGAFRAMVDIDDAELRKPTLRLDLPIHCDARIFIEEMLRLARQTPLAPKPSWIQWCRELDTHLPGIHDDNPAPQGAVSSYEFAEWLFDRLGDGDLVVTGNGTAYTGTFQVMRLRRGVRVFTNQGCASMGYDLPAAIGACIARDRKPVVCITGDGSIQMNIQELQTIVALNLPIRIFVLNNCGYLAIRTTQNTYFEGRYVGSCPEGGVSCPDMLRIANAYGIPAQRVSDPGDLDAALDATLKAEGPVICEVMMDPNQTLYPKLSSVVRPDGAMISKPLEDMYPLLRRDLFKKLMQITPLD